MVSVYGPTEATIASSYHTLPAIPASEGEAIPNAIDLHHQVDRLQLQMFAHLLDRLQSYETPSGTTLDDGVSVWLNDLSAGPPHAGENVPWILAGSCGGRESSVR